MTPPRVSIIIPVFHEEPIICETLDTLASLKNAAMAEVILVDGDPGGSTLAAAAGYRVRKAVAPRGRGLQMNAGAGLAGGRILLFLHADTRLPGDALDAVCTACSEQGASAGAFDLGVDSCKTAFRLIERMVYWRTRITRIPYGDQAIFVTRRLFQRLGGYRSIPIMEDVDLMRRIRKYGGRITIIEKKVSASARRWEKEGIGACTLRNWLLAAAFFAGADPERLRKYYP